MSAKAILVFCAQALFVQSALSQCIGAGLASPYGLAASGLAIDGLAGLGARGLAYDGLAGPLGYDGLSWAGRGLGYDGIYGAAAPGIDFTPTSGGGLPVSSVSSNAPVGISLKSDNAYEGTLEVVGELPFVGTVGFERLDLPTIGTGAVNHACGNGDNSMVSGDAAFAPAIGAFGAIAPAAAMAPGLGPYGAIAPAAAMAPGLGCSAAWAGRRIAL